MACKGLLWVGTSTGACLTVPLPRLEGVPIIGRFDVSYHAHSGPVTFLLPLYSPKSHSDLGTLRRKEADITDDNANNTLSQRAETKNVNDTATSVSVKLRQQLVNSPVVLRRRRSKDGTNDISSRGSKTLPRSLGSFSAASTTSSQGSGDTCDVYGLYGELMYIKDYEETGTSFESPLRRSDPDLAAIPAKVSTLDRRLRWKCGRPRSLDLSNWSPDDSRCSSGLCTTSSGSEESVAASRRGVSRNNSAASERLTPDITLNSPVPTISQSTPAPATTNIIKNSSKRGPVANLQESKRTIITLCGGRGYLNWRPQTCPSNLDKQKQLGHQLTKVSPNTNDAHIILWEKKL
uniref:Putative product n=1 Tax=Xenopsylla cheopis TaxID=163159 RepID=A0A6M2E4D3_XENCH